MSWANWTHRRIIRRPVGVNINVCSLMKTFQSGFPYHPGLVAHVVDRFQGVDARCSSVLQTNDEVAEIFVLGHTEGVLTDEDKVWLE